MALSDIPFSVLDLAPVRQGGSVPEAFANALDLARNAEAFGYRRYWLAEHHSIPGIVSAATAVVIGYIAGGTKTIRVGSGGIMLPNHTPFQIAEQFGTLESMYPGRIDLGLGRAPGGDMRTANALRRPLTGTGDSFPLDLEELRGYFRAGGPGNGVRAIPGDGLEVPVYLLGSSDYSAKLAGELGLPFAFASHFAPDYLHEALRIYRQCFEPSTVLDRPHAIVAVNTFVAESDEEARRLYTSAQQQFLNIIRGTRGLLPPPVEDMNRVWSPTERARVQGMMACSAVGSAETVREGLERIVAGTGADELILTAQIHDHAARVRSFGLAAGLRGPVRGRVAGASIIDVGEAREVAINRVVTLQ